MAEANAGKALTVEVEGAKYSRIPIRTHVVMPGDDLDAFIREYATDVVAPGDIFFVTEKIVAITQGRSYLVEDIKPRRLALFLSKFVVRTPYGIGLGMPETMEMALRECGTIRILFAAAVSAVTKLFGRKGDFYRIAGDKARAIDGPTRRHDPAVQQGGRARPRAPARGRAPPEGDARRVGRGRRRRHQRPRRQHPRLDARQGRREATRGDPQGQPARPGPPVDAARRRRGPLRTRSRRGTGPCARCGCR